MLFFTWTSRVANNNHSTFISWRWTLIRWNLNWHWLFLGNISSTLGYNISKYLRLQHIPVSELDLTGTADSLDLDLAAVDDLYSVSYTATSSASKLVVIPTPEPIFLSRFACGFPCLFRCLFICSLHLFEKNLTAYVAVTKWLLKNGALSAQE